jgi:hypothetical protein
MKREGIPQDADRAAKPAGRAIWKRMVFPFAATCIGLLATLLLVEAALQVAPGLFSRGVQHLAYSRYDALPGGMYIQERQTRMRFMRANVSMRAYSHGYWWRHSTDALGFRAPPDLERRDVLLLGDSLVYGHGVEENQTVAHFLRSEHDVAAYNMGRQGQCLYECYVTYRLHAEELQPEAVVVFVFLNDVLDLVNRRRPEELADPPEIRQFDYRTIGEKARELQNYRQPLMTRLAYRLATVRLVKKYLFLRSKSGKTRPAARRQRTPGADLNPAAETEAPLLSVTEPPPTPTPSPKGVKVTKGGKVVPKTRVRERAVDPVLSAERMRPVRRYYNLILNDMDRRCDAAGTRLVVVQLFLAKSNRGAKHLKSQEQIRKLLSGISGRRGFQFHDTKELFGNCDECFLPDDGHLTELGHRRLAEFLADILEPEAPRTAPSADPPF